MDIKNAKVVRQRNSYYLSVEVNGVRKNIKAYGAVAPKPDTAEDDYLIYVQGFADATKELGSLMSKIQFSGGVDMADAKAISFAKPMSHSEALVKSTKANASYVAPQKKKKSESVVGESGKSLFSFKKGRA